ncbi:hypothetical protein GC089_00630 [Cellulomonas sp. JZ18]|uniref:hypothetical protein n=1 Tax=Cellulomonas sp. JZ18 TaxID=2654191 RepID=UPI0012D4AAE5|nr:hypothetical protein [Cellulomonas sp. JZ18]QGQ18047.1 hypothetical protein GC089_00630 [Cellulomonas sp. JZ18]
MPALAKATSAAAAVVVGAALGLVTYAVDDALAGLERAPAAVERGTGTPAGPTGPAGTVRTAAADG